MRTPLLLATLVVVPALLTAQGAPVRRSSTGPTLGLAVELAAEMGGDDFLEVFFTSGTSQKLRAGQGGSIALGGIVRPRAGSPLSLRGTIGFKYVTTAANNADIRFTRIPVKLVGSYDFPRGARVGAGLVHHASNSFKGDGFVPDVTFDPATGATAEVGYKAIALTYTALKYKAPGGNSLDAGSIGVQVLWTPKFGRK